MKTLPTAAQLAPLIAERWINAERHPTLPLTVYNYSHRCQFARNWTDTTMTCRGLILHDDGRVIARPMKKFFNLDEMPRSWNPPSKTFTVTTKEDGSLGILYRTDTGIAMATRGSFAGIQAVKATAMVQQYADLPWETDRFTYLFEIIYPENRIVVDYGDRERLVMLAVIDTATGKDMPLPDWFPHHVKAWPEITDLQTLKDHAVPNAEGFVVRFRNGFRVKVKFDEYVRLHHLLTGVNAKTVWEWLAAGVDVEAQLGAVPDEFYGWVKQTVKELTVAYGRVWTQCLEDFAKRPESDDRRIQADYLKTCAYPPVLFLMLDGKDATAMIWKLVKPTATRPFVEGDD